MGHITKIKINHQVGHIAQVSELEGSIDVSELLDVRVAMSFQPTDEEDSASTVDWNDRMRSKVCELATTFGWRTQHHLTLKANSYAALDWMIDNVSPSKDNPLETARVPRSSMDGGPEDGEVPAAIMWQREWEKIHAQFDAARGAVRILATAVGIESGDVCDVAKLGKQVHGRVASMSTQYWSMGDELQNLRGAMTRMQMPDVPQGEDGMELPKQCQALAHHMDVLKRTGFAVAPEEAKEGVHVHAPQTREERFERLKVAQQEATRMMIDLATIDGYVSKDTPADEVMAKTMAWSVRIDQERRLEEEGVKKGAPTTGDPKVGVATVTQNHQPGLDVKVAFSPDSAGGEGVAKSVAELIGLKMKDAIESASTGPFENDDEKAELEGGGNASELD